MKTLLLRLAVSAACISFLTNASARPRPPIVPFPELTLKSWKFDYPPWVTAERMGAHIATNLWLAESWSGYALYMATTDSLLLTPAVVGYRTNFTQGSGTIRLWFSPSWSSTSVGGAGPGDWATLFEIGQTNTVTNPFGLAVAIDPAGTNLVAALSTTNGVVTLVQLPIAWTNGVWHQVAFVYWPSGVSLVVDDQPEQVSSTVPTWPSNTIWNQSAFSLGSALDAGQSAQGQLDEIHTFGYALSTNYLTWSYQLYSPIAALGPLPNEEGGGLETLSDDPPAPCDPCEGEGDPFVPGPPGFSETNGLRFAATPYRTNATNLATTLLDTNSSSRAYQIFQTLQLQSIPSNTVWTLAANGALGVTNFNLSFSTNTTNASFLAARVTDADGDGFSDAFESLVLKSNPNQFNDTNSDGIGDRQLVLEWDMQTLDGTNAQGTLFQGNGFQIVANQGNDPKLLKIFFDQRYRGYPLKDFPRDTPHAIRVVLTNIDLTLTHTK